MDNLGVYVWGNNSGEQLCAETKDKYINHPVYSVISDSNYLQIACGEDHAIFIEKEGKVSASGNNHDGKLGIGEAEIGGFKMPVPLPIFSKKKIVQVACGYSHSAAVDANGDCYTWGMGIHGALGQGDNKKRAEPELVDLFSGKRVISYPQQNNYE